MGEVEVTIIKMDNVKKIFNKQVLFENVNLEIEEGKIYGIVGPNGSGKSVLFKLMCGFIFPDNGSVIVRNEELGKNKRFPKDFGIIIDRPGYIANKTGFENLKSLALIQSTISDEEIKESMIKVGLNPTTTQTVKNYSLGMKQKLALAQAIMENQTVLLLDEPFNALDNDSVENIRTLLLNIRQEGKTIVLTSHNSEDINILCDHVYRINNFTIQKIL